MKGRFATSLNCMDGRAQLPVIKWITSHYPVDYVDMITEPGMVKLISSEKFDVKLLNKLNISFLNHDSQMVFVVGHYDCAGNPVEEDLHKKQIIISAEVIKNLIQFPSVIGLWLDKDFNVDKLIEL